MSKFNFINAHTNKVLPAHVLMGLTYAQTHYLHISYTAVCSRK